MTLAADRRSRPVSRLSATPRPAEQPVESWPTSAIRSALDDGDIATWRRIVVALKRDPYGRTARQVEEVFEGARPYGISKALWEVLERARAHLESDELAEVARQVRRLVDHSGLKEREFATRIGVPVETLATYLEGKISPTASLLIRMRRLSDRFGEVRSQRSVTKGQLLKVVEER